MKFREENIADSVVRRITEIAASVRTNTPIPKARGAATVSMTKSASGDLMVTKTFDNGETELLTISNTETTAAPGQELPEGFTDVTPEQQTAPLGGIEEQLTASHDSGVIANAATGGNALDALLQAEA